MDEELEVPGQAGRERSISLKLPRPEVQPSIPAHLMEGLPPPPGCQRLAFAILLPSGDSPHPEREPFGCPALSGCGTIFSPWVSDGLPWRRESERWQFEGGEVGRGEERLLPPLQKYPRNVCLLELACIFSSAAHGQQVVGSSQPPSCLLLKCMTGMGRLWQGRGHTLSHCCWATMGSRMLGSKELARMPLDS